jgi:hypothetical protein
MTIRTLIAATIIIIGGIYSVIIGGGYLTNRISIIGLHVQTSLIKGPYKDNNVTIHIAEYDLRVSKKQESLLGEYYWEPNNMIEDLGDYNINSGNIKWDSAGSPTTPFFTGEIVLDIKGRLKYFQAIRENYPNGYLISISSQNKNWKWYPAQLLLLITYPLDGFYSFGRFAFIIVAYFGFGYKL